MSEERTSDVSASVLCSAHHVTLTQFTSVWSAQSPTRVEKRLTMKQSSRSAPCLTMTLHFNAQRALKVSVTFLHTVPPLTDNKSSSPLSFVLIVQECFHACGIMFVQQVRLPVVCLVQLFRLFISRMSSMSSQNKTACSICSRFSPPKTCGDYFTSKPDVLAEIKI